MGPSQAPVSVPTLEGMSLLSYERRCAEIVHQASLLAASLEGADLGVQVPSCPDWTVNQLVRHVGYALRWADEMIRTRTPEIPFDRNKAMNVSGYAGEQASDLAPWLVEGATSLSAALSEVDPDLMIASLGGHPGPQVWSRRMTHELALHRWDAVTALGLPFELDPEVAGDALAEWAGLALPLAFYRTPEQTAPLLGPGRTVHLHATDADAELLIDLTGAAPVVRHDHEKAAVALRGPVVELVLTVYRRRPLEGLEVFGDADLLAELLERVRF